MTNDEILALVALTGNEPTDAEMIAFARAIESRTLTNQKAKWYLMGAEDERRACARLCQEFLAMECADAIRARGKWDE